MLNALWTYCRTYKALPARCWRGIVFALAESTLTKIFYFLTLYFVHDLQMDVASAGLLISFYGVGAIVGGYVAGHLAQFVAAQRICLMSMLLQAACYLVLVKVTQFVPLAITLFCLGVASYGFITANHLSVLTASSHDARLKVKVINLLSTASNLGSGFAGLVLGCILFVGFPCLFVITSCLLLLLAMLWIVTASPVNTCASLSHSGGGRDTSSANVVAIRYSQPVILITLIAVFFVGMVVSQLGTTYPLFIREAFPQMGVKAVSILFALNALLVVLLATPLGDYCQRFNKLSMMGLGGFFIGTGMFMLAFTSAYPFAIMACIVFTLGEMTFFGFAQYVCFHAEQGNGKGLGLFRAVYATSRMAGPMLGGFFYHTANGKAVWYGCGVIAVSCLLAVLWSAFKRTRVCVDKVCQEGVISAV